MKNFVLFAVFVILFSYDCSACFKEDKNNTMSVPTGSPYFEECCCEEPGFTIKDIQWLDPFNKVIVGPGTDSTVYIEEQSNCISLQISNASKMLSGAYRCVTTFETTQHSQVYYLDVFDPLYFYATDENQYLVYSNDSRITCQPKGASPPIVTWYKVINGEQHEIFNNTTKYQIMPEGLIVKNVNNDDEGIYRCSVIVPTTAEDNARDIYVKVMTPPEITQLAAIPDTVLVTGESLIIQCIAKGLPQPKIEWNKIPEASPSENKTVRWKQTNDSLRFKSIAPEDAATYECTAKNDFGITKKQINITVYTQPEIIGFNKIRSAVEGSMLPIICNATGLPQPNVTITHGVQTWDEQREIEYDVEIPNYSTIQVNRSDEGIYVCHATNVVNTTTEVMYLSVLHQPYFDETYELVWAWNGETINISCAHDSNPKANFTWSYTKSNFSTIEQQGPDNIVLNYETTLNHSFPFSNKFAPFGKHECAARNEYGDSVKTFDIQKGFPPSFVENSTTTDVAATSATFNIETPIDYEGPAVIGYIAEYDEEENYKITNIHPNRTWATGREFKLEKLKPNTTYYIKFAAINPVGTGEWSDTIAFVTMDKSAPEPPIWQVNALVLSSNKMLKWKAPENNGEPIDCYFLRYCPVDDEPEEVLDESLCIEQQLKDSTELHVPDLVQNTTYFFELIAHNTVGNSTPANMSITIVPSAPGSLLSAGALIGISIVVVVVCLVLLDLLLYFWKKQGIIASCCCKKSTKKKPNPLNARDKKGLLKDSGESGTGDTLKRPNNGHKEYEYNKTTGIITGKHSSV